MKKKFTSVETSSPEQMAHKLHVGKRWKARFIVCVTMLLLAFIGLILMDLHSTFYWLYSRCMAVTFAALNLWLFWYLHRGQHKITGTTIGHQCLHWIALLLAIYLIDLFVKTGMMGYTQAGLATLTLLALTVFLSGIYTDTSFMFIGFILAIFAASAGLIQAYLPLFMFPVLLIAGFILFLFIHHQHKKAVDLS